MSEIQDLLNASTQDMVDDYLIIDDNSREIYVPLGELLFGVTNDEKTKNQLDIFFYGDRITQEQYKELMELIDSNVIEEEKTTLEEE